MIKDFTEVMSRKTDDELIKIISADRDDYQPSAIEAAESEISKRNINQEYFEKIKTRSINQKNTKQEVESNVVSSFTRFIHFIIDTLVWILIFTILGILLGPIFSYLFQIETEVGVNFYFFFLSIFVFVSYYYFMESKWQKTIAKFITRTKVVHQEGRVPSNSEIFRRTISRFIPFDRFSFLFVKNGLHDFLSNTNVIKDKC